LRCIVLRRRDFNGGDAVVRFRPRGTFLRLDRIDTFVTNGILPVCDKTAPFSNSESNSRPPAARWEPLVSARHPTPAAAIAENALGALLDAVAVPPRISAWRRSESEVAPLAAIRLRRRRRYGGLALRYHGRLRTGRAAFRAEQSATKNWRVLRARRAAVLAGCRPTRREARWPALRCGYRISSLCCCCHWNHLFFSCALIASVACRRGHRG
jgi:hypothetical protein